ncbi:hypothetical protein TIFTF001_006919 [Ficus carica]|uniref:Phytocyanin domain-containing protein n=1 Tax=Ficus carica TaxID=3494 RepID=A0AA87ZIA4_FICCA|nr:hypothetical protein TIFTF001_006919 [Ficus carica]
MGSIFAVCHSTADCFHLRGKLRRGEHPCSTQEDHFFKYDPPSKGANPHSVYVLPDIWSFKNCDLRRARKVANGTQGGGRYGYEFKLKIRKTHYFACGESNGIHCNLGLMKFSVFPIPRVWRK